MGGFRAWVEPYCGNSINAYISLCKWGDLQKRYQGLRPSCTSSEAPLLQPRTPLPVPPGSAYCYPGQVRHSVDESLRPNLRVRACRSVLPIRPSCTTCRGCRTRGLHAAITEDGILVALHPQRPSCMSALLRNCFPS